MSIPPPLTIDPIIWPEGDEYRDAAVYRAAERFHWHATVAEVVRRHTAAGRPQVYVGSISAEMYGYRVWREHFGDVAAYCRQMITWGELVKAAPDPDRHEPEFWVSLPA